MESDVTGPDIADPNVNGPNVSGPNVNGPDIGAPGIRGSSAGQPGSSRQGTGRRGVGRADIRWWQVQEAKQRFSEVLRAAESGEPQIVTRHGEEVAVLIDIAQYHHLKGQSVGFMEYLRSEPLLDADLEIERPADPPRTVDLPD